MIHSSEIAMVLLPAVQVLLAWLLIDMLTGLYHLATDRGWNFKFMVDQFQEHHQTNRMEGFDWQPMVAGVPVMLAATWFESSFWLAAGSFAILAQIPHYYAHVPNPPAAVKLLQRWGLIITPEHHAGHHSGDFDRNFCIFTGWGDLILNPVVKLLPKHEEHPLCPHQLDIAGKTNNLPLGASAAAKPSRAVAGD